MSAPTPATGQRSTPGVVLVAASALAVLGQCYGLYRSRNPTRLDWLPYADKVGHLLGFAVPVLLVLLTVSWFTKRVSTRAYRVVIGTFAVQAVVSELVQGWAFPERTGDVADLLADLVGIAVGVIVFRLIRSRRR